MVEKQCRVTEPKRHCRNAHMHSHTHRRTFSDAGSDDREENAAERRMQCTSSAGRVEHFRAANGKREAVDAGGQQFGPTLEE